LRIAVPFVAGIIYMVAVQLHISFEIILCVAFISFIVLFLSYYLVRSDYGSRWIAGLSSNIALFLVGAILVAITGIRDQPEGTATDGHIQADIFLCRIVDAPVRETTSNMGIALLLAHLDSLNHWSADKRNVLVYFKSDSLSATLKYGDTFIFSGSLQSIAGPQNPSMFNYRQYLINRQIAYQVYLEPDRWRWIGRMASNPLRSTAEKCRARCLDIFRKFKVEGQDFALVSALLLGRKEYLDKEIMREFSHAGVIHVLCVSGLHVGIMYVVADRVFFFLKRNRKSRKFHQILILACIWAYAFIAGLPVSVIRAALMFSLIAAAKMFKRSPESYNIVAVAAFFQLLINPYDITQVGFQLSYVAVIGIFAFYKPFNELINPSNKIVSGIWSVLAVSTAAQLATFPLACHYFNIFPVYFLLTNLIVVPLAGVITYYAVFLLALGATGITFEWLALPLKWSLGFMSGSVDYIQNLPGAVIEPIILPALQVILIYLAITGLFVFWAMARRKGAFVILGALLIFCSVSGKQLFDKLKSSEIDVYQVPGHIAIDLLNKNKALFICDSLLANDPQKIDFQVKPNRVNKGIRDIDVLLADNLPVLSWPGAWIKYPFIYFRGKTLVIIDSGWKNHQAVEVVPCDIAIFSGNLKINPGKLKSQINIGKAVIDSSVPGYKAEQLMQFFQKENIPCHSVRHAGAFVLKW
jgi:competence protein ComEC